MEIDVDISKSRPTEPLMTISAGSYSNNNSTNSNINNNNNNNNNTNAQNATSSSSSSSSTSSSTTASATAAAMATTAPISDVGRHSTGCCGILSRLLCVKSNTGKTANSSSDYNNFTNSSTSCVSTIAQTSKKTQNRRTPQEIYWDSRGKSCKKLLKFNGHSNKILLYPEEGWARTASSSYWTITPCWWQPNRCRIEEFSGTQRHATKAKMQSLEQKGSLLITGHFTTNNSSTKTNNLTSVHSFGRAGVQTISGSTQCKNSTTAAASSLSASSASSSSATLPTSSDEFKLYLSSNISMEDYNMGYCLTGFVERRCQQTNAFQMTHFAVIKRQWPSIGNNGKTT